MLRIDVTKSDATSQQHAAATDKCAISNLAIVKISLRTGSFLKKKIHLFRRNY